MLKSPAEETNETTSAVPRAAKRRFVVGCGLVLLGLGTALFESSISNLLGIVSGPVLGAALLCAAIGVTTLLLRRAQDWHSFESEPTFVFRVLLAMATFSLAVVAIWLLGHEPMAVSFRGRIPPEMRQWNLSFSSPSTAVATADLVTREGRVRGIDLTVPAGTTARKVRSLEYLTNRPTAELSTRDSMRETFFSRSDSLGVGRSTSVRWHGASWWWSTSVAIKNATIDGSEQGGVSLHFVLDSRRMRYPSAHCYLTLQDSTRTSRPQLDIVFGVLASRDWRLGPDSGTTRIVLPNEPVQGRCYWPATPTSPSGEHTVSVTAREGLPTVSVRGDGLLTQRNIPGTLSVGARQHDVTTPSLVDYLGPTSVETRPDSTIEWTSEAVGSMLMLNGEPLLPRRYSRYADLLGLGVLSGLLAGWTFLFRAALPAARHKRAGQASSGNDN